VAALLHVHRAGENPEIGFTSGGSCYHVSGKRKPVAQLGHSSASLPISRERRGGDTSYHIVWGAASLSVG